MGQSEGEASGGGRRYSRGLLGLVGETEPRICGTCDTAAIHHQIIYLHLGEVWVASEHPARCGLICSGSLTVSTDDLSQLHYSDCVICARRQWVAHG